MTIRFIVMVDILPIDPANSSEIQGNVDFSFIQFSCVFKWGITCSHVLHPIRHCGSLNNKSFPQQQLNVPSTWNVKVCTRDYSLQRYLHRTTLHFSRYGTTLAVLQFNYLYITGIRYIVYIIHTGLYTRSFAPVTKSVHSHVRLTLGESAPPDRTTHNTTEDYVPNQTRLQIISSIIYTNWTNTRTTSSL